MTVVYIEKFNGQHGYKVAHTTTTGAAAGWLAAPPSNSRRRHNF
jgi:hypothetical protein